MKGVVLVDPVAMLGPSDADLARAIAREHYKLQCQLLVEDGVPSFELRRRRLRLIGLAPLWKLSVRKLGLADIVTSATSSDTLRRSIDS